MGVALSCLSEKSKGSLLVPVQGHDMCHALIFCPIPGQAAYRGLGMSPLPNNLFRGGNTMRKTVVFGLLAALLVAPSAGMAGDSGSAFVDGTLTTAALRWRVSGYKEEGRETGKLRQGENKVYQVKLERGKTYKIFGSCDMDCLDMDMYLNHKLLGELESSTSKDHHGFPIIDAGPTRLPLNVSLKVHMKTCKKEPCGYGIVVLRKD